MNNKYHDIKIISIAFDSIEKRMFLGLDDYGSLLLENVEYFQLTPFEQQNVIYELNEYDKNSMPSNIMDNYKWISKYISDYKFIVIDSSCGMQGVIVCK